MSRRISNRRHPPRNCKNPECILAFVPHDRRQQYCEPQCRINANNDKRLLINNTRFSQEKQVRQNNKILEEIWHKIGHKKDKLINKSTLQWEKFNFDCPFLITWNAKTKGTILWSHNYGLELVDASKEIYEVHKKS